MLKKKAPFGIICFQLFFQASYMQIQEKWRFFGQYPVVFESFCAEFIPSGTVVVLWIHSMKQRVVWSLEKLPPPLTFWERCCQQSWHIIAIIYGYIPCMYIDMYIYIYVFIFIFISHKI